MSDKGQSLIFLEGGAIVSEDVLLKKVLKDFGITETEGEIYLIIAKNGPSKGTDIAKQTKKDKAQIYHILRSLQSKGIVEATLEVPVRFAAIPFERIVDSAIKSRRDEAARIENAKQELLSYWNKLGKRQPNVNPEKFSVIEGLERIYSKVSQMITETQRTLSATITVEGLASAYKLGILDEISEHPRKADIAFRYLTDLSINNLPLMKSMLKSTSTLGLNIKGRNPDVGLEIFSQMVIKDQDEALFFLSSINDLQPRIDDVCLWTNCKTLVHSFLVVFEDLWNNSSDIQRRILEVETGKPKPKSDVLKDLKETQARFAELIVNARKSISLLTFAPRLIELSQDIHFLSKAKGLPVRILAPITKNNLEAAQLLSRHCEVRHVSVSYWETLIVDDRYVLQVNYQSGSLSTSCFQNAFCSEEDEYVKTMKLAFNDFWNKAQVPSKTSVESVILSHALIFPLPQNNLLFKLSSSVIEFKPPGSITEKDVVEKIINAQRLVAVNPARDPSRMYASVALARICPPESFQLPELLISPWHVDKHSSFGGEDCIVAYQQFPGDQAFTPVAIVGDNPFSKVLMAEIYRGTPAGENHIVVQKDEIQIRMHGNTLFAAWAVPIPLYPNTLHLPPACLQIEGYGNAKTIGYSVVLPSGFKHEAEQNYFDAFVTFFHPASKYSGPGTDAVFSRDTIITNYPPKT